MGYNVLVVRDRPTKRRMMSKKNIKIGKTYFFYGWNGEKLSMTPIMG